HDLRPDAGRDSRQERGYAERPHRTTGQDQALHSDGRGEPRHVSQGPDAGQPEKRAGSGEHRRRPRRWLRLRSSIQKRKQAKHPGQGQPRCQRTGDRERLELARHEGSEHAGDGNEDGIAGRVRLMAGDVEVANAKGEVDGIDVFERPGEEPEVRSNKERDQRTGSEPPGQCHAGLSSNPSLRLPVRYPCKSIVTCLKPSAFKSLTIVAETSGSSARTISSRPSSIRAISSW